jgi:hypothetical protein
MAETDLRRVRPLIEKFNAAGLKADLPPALLAAIASRESRCGNVLDPHGFGDGKYAFGIMQVDKRSHNLEGLPDPRSQNTRPSCQDPQGRLGGRATQIPQRAAGTATASRCLCL